jgi:opacity protein-like surface antigen
MKKIVICIGLLGGTICSAWAQDVGLSFSYFIPRNGDFSTPISPFSIRGLGFNLNRFIALETGASLYRMSGMGMIDLPFESKNSLIGPNFTILVPAELVFQLKGEKVEFDIKGGGFFFYGFDQHLNNGNIDRALRQYQSWDVVNSNLTYENNPGFGYHFGAELTIPVTGQVSVSLETNYLMGTSKFPLKGSYTGGTLNGTNQTVVVDYKDAKIDFTGLEFSIGLIFSSGGGGGRPKAKRRR